jgi:uncharacterized protein YbjT (DUF2867 family)
MTTAVIGATGRVGRAVVRGLLEDKRSVIAIVRDAARARQVLGPADDAGTGSLDIRQAQLGHLAEVRAALDGTGTVFIAMGSAGLEGNLQRVVIQAAATAPIEQFVRLSVLNTSATSLGINQRAHWNIDFAAEVAGLPYTTIRPAIFSASLLAAAAEVRASRTWTGLAGTGRVALIDAAAVGRTGRAGHLRHHRRAGSPGPPDRRRRPPVPGRTADRARMGPAGGGERAHHHRGERPDRAPAAHRRGLPAREPRLVPLAGHGGGRRAERDIRDLLIGTSSVNWPLAAGAATAGAH